MSISDSVTSIHDGNKKFGSHLKMSKDFLRFYQTIRYLYLLCFLWNIKQNLKPETVVQMNFF